NRRGGFAGHAVRAQVARDHDGRSRSNQATRIQETENHRSAGSDNVRGDALREAGGVGKSSRVAGGQHRPGNYLAANRRAPVYTQKSPWIQFPEVSADMQR